MLRIAVTLGALQLAASTSHALDIVCPEKILTTQKLDGQAAGWKEFVRPNGKGSVDTYSYASGISIYYGDPEEIAELKPDSEMARNPSWSFVKAPPGTPLIYMACHYHETRIQFVRALPANVKKCTSKPGGLLQCELFKP
ncbi:STY0301 family protein [Inhella gelatinilytica]|uniref:Uncharacterized protein n=1 Tax=Inhella gelatinilytica TaxID=2795030 RepID=A0A931NEB2_9BURK|nr:STY0301 family protein [Inhella gelatinilytica]MBH9553070.1 hypothetical protein [Inhella gelatinilytica]